jgi:RNA polymerase sigma-70 factor (ECF subfamily)
VYILKEVEGMDNPEIEKCLGISENNIKVRLHRAKHLLKDSLYQLHYNQEIFPFGNSHCDRIVNNVMRLI